MSEHYAKFWMVWCTSRGGPVVKHWSKDAAETEAKRLSSEHPGFIFVVMSAVSAFTANIEPPRSIPISKKAAAKIAETDDGIPF